MLTMYTISNHLECVQSGIEFIIDALFGNFA